MQRIVVFGNSGSGKTTLARSLAHDCNLAHLDLDQLAWSAPGVRRSFSESEAAICSFIQRELAWVLEGCYVDLLEIALPFCTELRFLNPGTEVCVANCMARPWEPEKYPSKEAQDEKLAFLLEWVRDYGRRSDEYSLMRHRELFDRYVGKKVEVTAAPA